ncbi:MAG: hypothetical protein E7029_05200 [Planctomycetaceae bacterium]|nr:hypothetical protein [Planctomycetaceae bacterium]
MLKQQKNVKDRKTEPKLPSQAAKRGLFQARKTKNGIKNTASTKVSSSKLSLQCKGTPSIGKIVK